MSTSKTSGLVDEIKRDLMGSDTIIYPEGSIASPGSKPIPPSPLQTTVSGFQHVIAMFGATVLGPVLMGFDPNVAIFFSGVATILFWVLVRQVPSYLGSSFSFIAAVIAATGYAGIGQNNNIPIALGGIVAAGVLYVIIGVIVRFVGHERIQSIMPPVITGVIVTIIGLNLAKVAVNEISGSSFNTEIGLLTIVLVVLPALYAPSFFRRLPILIGGLLSYFVYLILCNAFNFGVPIDFTAVGAAPWFGVPNFQTPVFTFQAVFLIAPVAIILVAENLGHVQAIGVIMERPLDKYLWRAFTVDGLCTILSGSFGGTGVTTYAENIGVMAFTKNFYSKIFLAAGLFAILFGLSPKVGAVIHTIPVPILGGLAFILFGLITASGFRIWVDSKVDFKQSRNLITVGVAVIMGSGDLTIKLGDFALGGIATATFAALILYHLLGAGHNSSVRN